ncbi:MAG: Y-family DNA polymerase [Rhodospirillales bacterium]|nr:Y-family DNA polymerase [Acetobacter sp.]
MFALVDCNSFYCSCERVFRPRLQGKPVVVLSNNDGCAIARTSEAKALGIPMGAPWFQWRDRFKTWGVEVFSSNYALYGDMSRRVMEVLAGFSPAVEVYSIDESFLHVQDWPSSQLAGYAGEIRERVLRWTGIPVGVGIGASKTLAKVANRAAKRTGGVFVVDHTSQESRALLEEWPVAKLWGIAGRFERRLAELGICTAGQLARAKPALLRQRFGVVVERMAMELRGISCLPLEIFQAPRKNICCSRSFGQPIDNLEDLREAVATHATRASEKLRRQRLAASAVHVFLHTNRRRPDLPQYFPAGGRELLVPTSFTPEIVGESLRVLEALYRPDYRYVKAGVLCLGLVPDEDRQNSLLWPVDRETERKQKALMRAADHLNFCYGRGTVRPASTGSRQAWAMRQNHLSPRYTTRIGDIPCAATG